MGGKSVKSISRTCDHCKKTFLATPYSVKKGNARFCSRGCTRWGRHPHKPEERFMALLTKEPNGCWVWNNKTLYPYFWHGSGKIKAHRWSYQHFKGEIPAKNEVCHSCDNPRCVNPDHLFLGSHQQNMKDAGDKGRLEWVKRLENDRDRYKNLYLKSEEENDELARRLKRACDFIEQVSYYAGVSNSRGLHDDCLKILDELEAMPEDKL